ncbi:SURF1 family protein, partial [Kineococcus glutinatus]|uniref:SURF1 family cytochrome oxidase biogenesis protein n=1 Tax=Kineococcus glutinatus TaxID=1070872 RepID=UPI0031EED661
MPTSVLSLLRERRWQGGLAVAVAVACACVLLGQWQWHRRQDRLERNAPLVANYDAPARPLAEVLPSAAAALPTSALWTPVTVRGRYDAAGTLLVRNRPLDGANGYEVLVPLRLDDGSALLVDRGWVPAGRSSSSPDAVPAPPQGEVEVTVRLRAGEATRPGRAEVAGQLQTISLPQAADQLPYPLLQAYGRLVAEQPRPAQLPAALPRPATDEGPHLAYTVQWYCFALAALGVWVVAGRRELQARAAAGAATAAGTGAGSPPGAPAP